MSKTKHFSTRMNQRAIQQALVDLTLEFGTEHGDQVILNRKALEDLLCHIEKLKSTAERARQKGGIVVVEENGKLITTFSLDSYRRPH